jgi:hypothetical protein
MSFSLLVLAQYMNLPLKNAIGQFTVAVHLVGIPAFIKGGLAQRPKYL